MLSTQNNLVQLFHDILSEKYPGFIIDCVYNALYMWNNRSLQLHFRQNDVSIMISGHRYNFEYNNPQFVDDVLQIIQTKWWCDE